jgi:hypothetical protein
MAATYKGQVQNGVIILDDGAPALPEGTKVRVETVRTEEAIRDLSRRLVSVAGKAKGLPPDLSEQHDHYIHGTPKR